jgi:hypothetical protein
VSALEVAEVMQCGADANPEHLVPNLESLGNSQDVSMILDLSHQFCVSSRCLVCITADTIRPRRVDVVAPISNSTIRINGPEAAFTP